MKYKTLSIVIPIYNEEKTLRQLLDKVLSVQFPIATEIILIDDGSKDKSWRMMQEYSRKKNVIAFQNEENMGKSQTVRRGVLESTGDLVVVQDADLEYEPAELVEFVAMFAEEAVDVVYGNRFGKKNRTIYPVLWLGNTFLSMVSNFFTYLRARMWVRDMEVCYKMIRGEFFRDIAGHLQATSTFGLEPEITARIARFKKKSGRHLKVRQVPISYYPRSYSEGKKISPIRDGLRAVFEIVKYNLFAK